jgi:hypothetical protein
MLGNPQWRRKNPRLRRKIMILMAAAVAGQAAHVQARSRDGACQLEKHDQAWLDGAIRAWRLMIRSVAQNFPKPPPTILIFSKTCTAQSTNAFSLNGQPAWTYRASASEVMLPDGKTLAPNTVVSFAGEQSGRAFYVMSTPSVWRDGKVPPGKIGLERLMTAVMLHESAHVSQFKTYMQQITDIAAANRLPDSFNDDSIQERYKTDAAFSASVARETELLFQSARASDATEARRLAKEARSLIVARRARYYLGADEYLTSVEDAFFSLEGSGQWLGYRWLIDPKGGRLSPDEAIAEFGRRGGWWSQEEGFALVLAADRLSSGAVRNKLFGDGARSGMQLLDWPQPN